MSTIKLDLDALVAEKIITPKTKEAIEQWNMEHHKNETGSRFFAIFGTIGAFATGLGIILYFAANWDMMSDIVKTLICIGTTLLFYLLGYIFTYRQTGFEKTGQSLTLLGTIAYGASIFLIGQIYNVGGSFAGALGLWCIGILPIAYLTAFSTVFALSIGLLYAFVFAYIDEHAIVASAFAYTLLIISMGYAFLSLSRVHISLYSRFATILRLVGGVSILGGTFVFTFNDFWRDGTSIYGYDVSDFSFTIFWIIAGFVALGLGNILLRIIRDRSWKFSLDLPYLVGLVPIVLLAIYTGNHHEALTTYSYDTPLILPAPEFIYVILMNLVYLGVTLTIIFAGIAREKASLVNVGILFFAIYLFGKYLAFVSDSKLEGSIVFISGGISCIAIGWLAESVRRRLLQKIQ